MAGHGRLRGKPESTPRKKATILCQNPYIFPYAKMLAEFWQIPTLKRIISGKLPMGGLDFENLRAN